MSSRIALPFLTLRESTVRTSQWELSFNGDHWTTHDEFVPDWDPASTLWFRRQVSLDAEASASDLGIPSEELRLSLAVRVGTGQGRIPRTIIHREAREFVGQENVELSFAVAGERLSALIDISTEIVLAAPPERADQLAPSRAGDRLWQDRSRLRLEGEEPRFPIEVADLSKLLGNALAASAPWYLHWSPRDWTRDFHGAIRLYLSEAEPEFVSKIEAQDPHILQAILSDVIGQVCERLVADPSAADLIANSEPGTLAAQASAWLREAWPNRDVAHIRALLENRPGAFRSTLLALAEQSET
ncbi:hypothetical protein [Aminobacter sp. HY435]|uniref:hypothetical protein n=1 Tax=Aminobacter sp. HY435 TaxID=2970917 RepID=UPI0022B949C5|nr:hypothetical protein [Aminobacter sp. HY435]